MATDLSKIPTNTSQTSKSAISMDSVLSDNPAPAPAPAPTPAPATDKDDDKKGTQTPPVDNTGKDTPPGNNDGGDNGDQGSSELQDLMTSLRGDDLSEDDKAVRDNLFSNFKATSINDKGELVGENGQVVATLEDIENFSNEDIYDDKGNLLDDEGKIVKTAADLAAENSIVNKLHRDSGYEFKDQEGNFKVYSDDEEGINEYTTDVANYKAQNAQSRFFADFPAIGEFAKHILSGGKVNDFRQSVDYSKVEVKDLTTEEKLAYIKESYVNANMGEARIKSLLDMVKTSSRIDAETENALADLTVQQNRKNQAKEDKIKQDRLERQKREDEYWDAVEATIKENKVANVTIPEADRQAFIDYVSAAVDDQGRSQQMIDQAKETLEQKLAFQYIQFKGYNLKDLIDGKANSKRVVSLRDRLKRSKTQKDTPINDANAGRTSGKPKAVSINDLI